MSNAHPAPVAPPAVTVAEKAAMLGAAIVVAALLLVPVTREAVLAVPVTMAHWVADVALGIGHTVGSLVGLG